MNARAETAIASSAIVAPGISTRNEAASVSTSGEPSAITAAATAKALYGMAPTARPHARSASTYMASDADWKASQLLFDCPNPAIHAARITECSGGYMSLPRRLVRTRCASWRANPCCNIRASL
ncbi:MAG: hypothetical protein R6X25_06995 [Candidatus Krumholzibacteriia bacterium]